MKSGVIHAIAYVALLATASIGSPQQAALNDAHAGASPGEPAIEVTPDQAMKRLVEGNQRFVSNLSEHPRTDQARRCETFVAGQHPFASILSCADSRAPAELLFDQGIGDIFVVRVAGNVADVDEIGTLEYGVGHLHTPLVVVLGHTKCGAVTAVVEGAKLPGHIGQLVDNILPAVQQAKQKQPQLRGEALIQAAIDANVMQSIQDLLTRSEEVRHLVGSGKVKVVGAVYDLHTGNVRWLDEHPQQPALLKLQPGHARQELDPPNPSAAHDDHTEHRDAPAHGQSPSSNAASMMPHQSGTLRGMLIPACFLGGAGLVSGAILYMTSSRSAHAPASATPPASA